MIPNINQNPKGVEIFSWKILNFLIKFMILSLWPKIVISNFLCEIIPKGMIRDKRRRTRWIVTHGSGSCSSSSSSASSITSNASIASNTTSYTSSSLQNRSAHAWFGTGSSGFLFLPGWTNGYTGSIGKESRISVIGRYGAFVITFFRSSLASLPTFLFFHGLQQCLEVIIYVFTLMAILKLS